MKFGCGRLLLVLLLSGSAACLLQAAPPDPGWVQIWGDEFDGTATNVNAYGLDLDNWTPRLPWLNSSDNTYWHSDNNCAWIADENAFVTNGTLVLRSKTCPPTTIPGHSTFNYSTAWVHSRNTAQYTFGYAETRLQSAAGSAMWPAWWFLGNGWPPEVDVFERYPYGRVHQGVYYNAGGTGTWDSAFFDADSVYSMHQWGFEWKPGHMGLSKDGVVRNDFYSTNVPAQPLYMVLSAGMTTNAQGGNLSSQSFPDDFIIDYVRIYKRAEHVYNGDFAARLADWDIANTNTTVAVGAGVSGGNALALANGADPFTPSRAAQLVYGLIPNTRYWVGASLNSAGNPVYLGISGHGGDPIEQATNSVGYAAVDFVFTNGGFGTTANLYARLDAGAGSSANADNIQLRRAAAVADPGFEVNDLAIYWDDSYGTVTIDSSNERSGNRCVALGAASSAAQQTIRGLRPNTTYQLSAWIRNNGNSQPCSLGVKNFGGAQVSVSTPGTANASYLPYSVTFTTGATNTTALIFVYAGAYNGVPIQADDFLLVEPLAAPWQQADIGAVGLTGAGGQRDGGFDIRGAGDNIWGTADSFRMIYRPVTNDCRITARVLKVDPTDPAAKVGITLREGITAGARHITLDWMPQQIVGALWRSTTNGSTSSQWAAGNVTTAPWLRLERAGNTFTGSWSPDGVHWTPVVTNVLSLPATLQAGLVVCAHNAAQLNEGLLDQVSVGPLTARIPEELAWNSAGAGGTWDVVSTNWRNATASSVVWSNALADGAAFGPTGVGLVSLATNITVRNLTFNTAGYTLANRVLTLAQPFVTANADATIASTLAGTAGLVKSGAGTLTLSGTNTYGGGTTVNAGRLRVGNPAALGGTNGTLTAAGGVLDLGGLGLTVGPVTFAGGAISNGTLTATAYAGQSGTVNAVLAGSNVALIKTSGGVLTLAATNTYTGGTLLNEGTLSISSLANLGGVSNPLTFSGGFLQISGTTLTNLNSQAVNWSTFAGGLDIANASTTFTVTNAISGGGALTKAGPGTLRLATPASYSGPTTINNGTLLLTNGSGIYRGVGGGPLTVNAGGVLSVSGDIGYNSTALGNMAAQAYGFFINGGTFRHTGTSNAKTGQPGAGRLFYIGEQGATLDSATAGQEFRLGYRYDYGSAVQSPFGGSLTLTGAGNGDFNYTLSGSGGLVKSGAGTWKLTGTNYFFSGPTEVNSGTLLVLGILTNSPVTVWGGTLGGNGAIRQPVTVQAGGSLAPGNGAIGTLTLQSNLTLLAGSQVAVEVNASTGASDLVANVNFISYGGTLVVTNLAGTVTNQQSFQLFSAAAATNTFSAIIPASPAAGLSWAFNPANGMLSARSMATNPTNLTASLSGTNLTFSWPADHTGWRLLVQTNRLNLGLSSNTNDWAVVPGSTATNQIVIPLDPAKPAAFYRMAY